MECIHAQELVSAALDNAEVDTAELADAKEHCRSCADCGAFVRTLVALRRSAIPEPPANLSARILDAVAAERAQAERAAAAIAGQRAREGSAADRSEPSQSPAEPVRLADMLRDPRRRAPLLAWASAAAAVIVVAGVAGVVGVRTMFSGTAEPLAVMESTAPPPEVLAGAADPTAGTQGARSGETAPAAKDQSAATGFIVLEGAVYRSAGPDTSVTEDSLSPAGTTYTSAVTQNAPRQEQVLGSGDPARVFIVGTGGVIFAFDRVTTSFQGRTYVLQSAPVQAYGDSVSLPDSITEPGSSDGYPTFEKQGDGTSGVFVLKDRDASAGIAFPPGAWPEFTNGWTWWLPASQ